MIERRQQIRERILDTTNALLARHGYRRMTMAELARQSGVGKGTLYLYFSSKEDVALSSIDRLIEQLADRLRELGERPGAVTARIEAMLRVRVMYRFDHLHQDSQSLDELFAAVRPAFLGRRQRYFNLEAELFARVLSEGRQSGTLIVDDPLETARTLLLATNALLPYSLSPRELGRRDQVEGDVKRVARLLIRGLARGTTPGAANDSGEQGVRSPVHPAARD
jgi:AcrR family transcriptional regulator